jgi:hypothetical protein
MSDKPMEMRYAGAVGLLCECSVHLSNSPESDDLRESIMEVARDWCADRDGWTVRRVLNRIEVTPP